MSFRSPASPLAAAASRRTRAAEKDESSPAESRRRRGAGGGGGVGGENEDGATRSSTQRDGGWSSINNQAGHPYQPLGAPMLDFVFHVQRRVPKYGSAGTVGHGAAAAVHQHGKHSAQSHVHAEEKETRSETDGCSKSASSQQQHRASSAGASNSLDLHDPVRDLLALCTPRRADALEGSLAIRERVALSQARVHAVRAGASFEQIDRAARARGRTEGFAREALRDAGAAAVAGANHSQSAVRGQGASAAPRWAPAPPSSLPASAAPAAQPPSFPHDSALSDDALGASLIQSHFSALAEGLASGSLNPLTPASQLRAQAARWGGPFPPNFNSNAFTNLAPHPLLAREQMEAEEKRRGGGGGGQGATGLPASSSRTLALQQQAQQTPTPAARAPTAPHLHTPGLPLHHAHAPPATLSFHALRYTLHQSFGTLEQQREKEAAAATARRVREAAAATARSAADRGAHSARGLAALNLSDAPAMDDGGGGAASTRSTTSTASFSSTVPVATTSRRGRSRAARLQNSGGSVAAAAAQAEASALAAASRHEAPASSATARDIEYTRAVHASKYRREHHNSPTSHWTRLRENIQQRATQLQALAHMAYFSAEGNVFQQGGALAREDARKRKQEQRKREQPAMGFGGAEYHGADLDVDEEEDEASDKKGGSHLLSRSARHVEADDDGANTRRRRGPASFPSLSIHDGQILRQVANTSWGLAEGGGEHSEAKDASDPSLTTRAELTLARCYADFDLAKRDLKERLLEGLALQDSLRDETTTRKYALFNPGYEDAEHDILSMRVRAEKARHRVAEERRENYAALYQLVQFINQQHGGTNGGPTSAAAAAAGATGTTGAGPAAGLPLPLPLPLLLGGQGSSLGTVDDLTTPGPGGLVGFAHGATLPSFEEIYLVEVLASLADSAVPLMAHHEANARVARALEAKRRAREKAHEMPASAAAAAAAQHHGRGGGAGSGTGTSSAQATPAGAASRRVSATSGAMTPLLSSRYVSSSSGGGGSFAFGSAPVAANNAPGASGAAAVSSPLSVPPPSLLLLLLSLSPSLFRLKEVREALERWVRLTGSTEEALDVGLRMVGVDTREPLFSAKGTMKELNGTASTGAAGSPATTATGEAGGADGSTAGESTAGGVMLLNESTLGGLLDASTKAALLHSAAMGLLAGGPGSSGGSIGAGGAGGNGVAAPLSRPLSSVILAPVSLGAWEARRAAERGAHTAREARRRARTVRALTTSSNARTRHALGLGDGKARAPPGHAPLSQVQLQQQMHAAAQAQAHAQAQAQAHNVDRELPSARSMPSKHTTGVSQSLAGATQQERDAKLHLMAAQQ